MVVDVEVIRLIFSLNLLRVMGIPLEDMMTVDLYKKTTLLSLNINSNLRMYQHNILRTNTVTCKLKVLFCVKGVLKDIMR